MIHQHFPILIPLPFLVAALLIPLLGIWKRRLAYPVALGTIVFVLGISLTALQYVLSEGTIRYHLGGWVPAIGIEYVLDPLAAFVVVVIVTIAFFVMIHAPNVVRLELPGRGVAYYGVAMLLLGGFTGVVITGDLFNLYVFLEIASLAGYGLVAAGEKKAPVAAFRYLLMGTIGASLYLLGLVFLYIMVGSLNMTVVARNLPFVYAEPTVVVGLVLIVVGIGIKMALFPMHGWLPDAYTYASSASSALIAPIGTKVGAYALIRILFFVFEPTYVRDTLPITDVLCWLAAAAILFGSILAMAQKELKRMLAYSSVVQIGYIGLGIGLANPLGFIGAVLHVLNHAFMKACLFLVAGNLRMSIGHSTIPDFDDSLRRQMPWTIASFAIAALSMIGIPPTAGFFSKWYIVLSGIEKSNWIFVGVILLSSLFNAVYFFRVLEKVYLRLPKSASESVHSPGMDSTLTGGYTNPSPPNAHREIQKPYGAGNEVRTSMLVPTLFLGFGLLVLGIFNAFIVNSVIKQMIPVGL